MDGRKVLLILVLIAAFVVLSMMYVWQGSPVSFIPVMPIVRQFVPVKDIVWQGVSDDLTLSVDSSLVRKLRHKSRVLCWIPSLAKLMSDRVKAVNRTWVPRCDGHIFFIKTNTSQYTDVIDLNVSDGRGVLTEKSVAALTYLYRHELEKYDWFVKGDDDAYILMENLRFLLAQYNSSRPVYLGHLFKLFVKQGYMSGGASYVLSREALRKLNEEGFQKKKCKVRGRDEDLDIGRCLQTVGVAPHNSMDKYGRAAFHPDTPSNHIGRDEVLPNWKSYNRFKGAGGKNCCSELTISFHHVRPMEMLVLDQLLYRTSVYGRVPDFSKLQGLLNQRPYPSIITVLRWIFPMMNYSEQTCAWPFEASGTF